MQVRWFVAAFLALAATVLAGDGQGVKPKRALLTVQAAGSGGSLSITFVQIGAPLSQSGANQASLDLGRLSYFGCSSQPGVTCRALSGALRVSTDFGIRVDRKGQAAKTATVSAFLLAGSTSFPVAIDGVTLTPTEQVIASGAGFGSVVSHTLSIDVPTTLPPGPLAITVGVMVTAN